MTIRSLPKAAFGAPIVRRSLVGVMTFNFDMTIWHIAYISIARGFFYNYYYLILEEKNYIFEGMLIKIVI